jgi:hypothetical protein
MAVWAKLVTVQWAGMVVGTAGVALAQRAGTSSACGDSAPVAGP